MNFSLFLASMVDYCNLHINDETYKPGRSFLIKLPYVFSRYSRFLSRLNDFTTYSDVIFFPSNTPHEEFFYLFFNLKIFETRSPYMVDFERMALTNDFLSLIKVFQLSVHRRHWYFDNHNFILGPIHNRSVPLIDVKILESIDFKPDPVIKIKLPYKRDLSAADRKAKKEAAYKESLMLSNSLMTKIKDFGYSYA